MIKAILFDIDDTLCSSRASQDEVYKQLYQEISKYKGLPWKRFEKAYTEGRVAYLSSFTGYGFNTYCRLAQWYDINRALGVYMKGEELLEVIDRYWRIIFDKIYLYPNVEKVLKALKGKGLILGTISGGDFYSKEKKLEKLGVSDYFDWNFPTELVFKDKNYPNIFEYALNYLSLKAEETVFIGDKPDQDIAPAKKLGMVTVQVMMRGDKPVGTGEEKPDYVINNMSELLTLELLSR